MPRPKAVISRTAVLLFGCVILCQAAYATYDARIREKEILTPAPAAGPRINGPKVYGAHPGKKFIYRIPCQGQRPIRFAVNALPADLKLDANEGILTGEVPCAYITQCSRNSRRTMPAY